MSNMPYRTIKFALKAREPFEDNSMTAHRGAGYSLGRLNSVERDRYYADHNDIAYIVYSYATPIAWVTNSGAIYYVEQKFSVTTSKQQSLVSQYLTTF